MKPQALTIGLSISKGKNRGQLKKKVLILAYSFLPTINPYIYLFSSLKAICFGYGYMKVSVKNSCVLVAAKQNKMPEDTYGVYIRPAQLKYL